MGSTQDRHGSSWLCICVTRNFSRDTCVFCGRSRDAISSAELNLEKPDWACECGTKNHTYRRTCVKCSLPKGEPEPEPTPQGVGDWLCVCGSMNHPYLNTCVTCHRPKEVLELRKKQPMQKVTVWYCVCGTINFSTRFKCIHCEYEGR